MDRLTIGIPCYNEVAHVTQCLDSVFAQDCGADRLRIILSDNGSTDGTPERVQAALDRAPAAMQAVTTVILQPRNIGIGPNFWALYDACETEYFMWLGGHDYLTPDFVSATLPLIAGDAGVAMATGLPRGVLEHGPQVALVKDAIYDFSDANPLVRYFKSVAELSNCTVFHSIFRHADMAGIPRISSPPLDHVMISHLLAKGRLAYSQAGYVRRYFRNQAPRPQPFYDMLFFETYLQTFEACFSGRVPEAVLQASRGALFTQLVNRFGMPPMPEAAAASAA